MEKGFTFKTDQTVQSQLGLPSQKIEIISLIFSKSLEIIRLSDVKKIGSNLL